MNTNDDPNLRIVAPFLKDQATLFQQLLETVEWDQSMLARKTAPLWNERFVRIEGQWLRMEDGDGSAASGGEVSVF